MSGAVIAALQKKPENIRNVCIIAHVDHGKTTICDSLVATNGHISGKSAGKLRFLDSREDEQERMITMKSSAISLAYQTNNENHLVNLIDSPGHVDFTSEVSTATRLSDGALVLVDVVEGISGQTREVLRQAFRDELKTILVLNKMDRLIINLKLEPDEAYLHIKKIIEQANACVHELLISDAIMKGNEAPTMGGPTPSGSPSGASTGKSAVKEEDEVDVEGHTIELDDDKENMWTYHPSKGNVIFTSAMHGWGFSISTFAKFVSSKLGASEATLQKTLWGEYYYSPKSKKIMRMKKVTASETAHAEKRSLFSQFCLDTIWKFYTATGTDDNTDTSTGAGAFSEVDTDLMGKLCKGIPVLNPLISKIPSLKPGCIRDVLGAWLPVAECVLSTVVRDLPSPVQANAYRIPVLLEVPLPPVTLSSLEGRKPLSNTSTSISNALLKSDPTESTTTPAVAYCTKYLGANLEKGLLLGDKLVGARQGLPDQFVGMTRVFSGTLKPGMVMLQATGGNKVESTTAAAVMGKPSSPGIPEDADWVVVPDEIPIVKDWSTLTIENIYTILGSHLVPIQTAEAGSIVALSFVNQAAHKSDRFCTLIQLTEETRLISREYLKSMITPTTPRTREALSSSNVTPTAAAGAATSGVHGAVPSWLPVFNSPYQTKSFAIVKVSVEAKSLLHQKDLIRGLELLHRGEPSLEVVQSASGEHIIGCSGDEHLKRCIKDLKSLYLHPEVDLVISEPLVAVRETVVGVAKIRDRGVGDFGNEIFLPPWAETGMNPAGIGGTVPGTTSLPVSSEWNNITENGEHTPSNQPGNQVAGNRLIGNQVGGDSSIGDGFTGAGGQCDGEKHPSGGQKYPAEIITSNKLLQITMRAEPLQITEEITNRESSSMMLEESADWILQKARKVLSAAASIEAKTPEEIEAFNTSEYVIANGQALAGNILAAFSSKGARTVLAGSPKVMEKLKKFPWLKAPLITGFEVASTRGPLCHEPVVDVLFIVDNVVKRLPTTGEKNNTFENSDDLDLKMIENTSNTPSTMNGLIISAMNECCLSAMLRRTCTRIAEPVLILDAQCDQLSLGKVYAIFRAKRSQILEEDLAEGTSLFKIRVKMPLVESFSLSGDLRNASGDVHYHAKFAGFEVIREDPFNELSLNADEIEEYGTDCRVTNISRKIVTKIRKRKGLPVDERVVKDGTKQRTMTRMK